jgi:coatomer subunit beta'
MEKLKTIEAHQDYIRCVVVHPSLPYILTSSDDMLIKLWDWEKGWQNTQVFEGKSKSKQRGNDSVFNSFSLFSLSLSRP